MSRATKQHVEEAWADVEKATPEGMEINAWDEYDDLAKHARQMEVDWRTGVIEDLLDGACWAHGELADAIKDELASIRSLVDDI